MAYVYNDLPVMHDRYGMAAARSPVDAWRQRDMAPRPSSVAQGDPFPDAQAKPRYRQARDVDARSIPSPLSYDAAASYMPGDVVSLDGKRYPLAFTPGGRPVQGIAPGDGFSGSNPWWYSGRVKEAPQVSTSPSLPVPVLPPAVDDATLSRLGTQRIPGYAAGSPSSTSVQLALPIHYQRALPVFKVTGRGEEGTAFRLGPNNIFVTNRHVIPAKDPHDHYGLWLGAEATQDGKGVKRPSMARVDKVLYQDTNYDITVFTVDDADYKSGMFDPFGYLGISTRMPRAGERVYMPNYGEHRPKHIDITSSDGAPGQVVRAYSNAHMGLITNLPTGYGSSGSPVMSADTHEVVGLHARVGGGGSPMSEIWPRIAHLFNGVPPKGSPLRPSASTPDDWLPRQQRPVNPDAWSAQRQYRWGDWVQHDGAFYRAMGNNRPAGEKPEFFAYTWRYEGPAS
jgi:hypothetical protein